MFVIELIKDNPISYLLRTESTVRRIIHLDMDDFYASNRKCNLSLFHLFIITIKMDPILYGTKCFNKFSIKIPIS